MLRDDGPSRTGTRLKPAPMKRVRLATPSHERLILDDGRELRLRPIAATDADPIRAGFALLTPEEIRFRYLHPMKSLGEEYLQKLTHPRRGRDCVLVVAEPLPPGDALIGAVARLSRVAGTREAEFAVLVSHFLAGQGLGRLLLKKLIAVARRWKLHAVHGDVLEDNATMLRLVEAFGFRREARDVPGIVRVRLPLPAARIKRKTSVRPIA